jgi:hypothetical protein
VGNWTLDQIPRVASFTWVKPGLFFGVKLAGESGVGLEGVGLGVQFAFIQNGVTLRSGETGSKPSWNVGVGWVNHRTKQLASGIVEGQPLPEDFQDIRYREGSDDGWVIMISKNVY